jgi:hypothetical protein
MTLERPSTAVHLGADSDFPGLKPIFHLHVPKTGGQSLGKRLAAGVGLGKAWYLDGDINSNDPGQLDALASDRQVVSAHVGYAALVDEHRFNFVSLVRDPIDQAVSNYLHILREPANSLHQDFANISVAAAVGLHGAAFSNFQSRSLVNAFFRPDPSELVAAEERFLTANLFKATDRLTWLAPTNAVDELCVHMSLQTGFDFTRDMSVVNAASNRGDPRGEELRQILESRPELNAIDQLLFREAHRRMIGLRESVVRSQRAEVAANQQPGIIYSGDGGSIQALGGWWQPFREVSGWGLEVRAGPEMVSWLHVVRKASRYLCFDIAFVAGINADELVFIDAANNAILPFFVVDGGENTAIAVDLADAPHDCEVAMRVPRIYPLARFDGDWKDADRLVSISTGHWSLRNDKPAGVTR